MSALAPQQGSDPSSQVETDRARAREIWLAIGRYYTGIMTDAGTVAALKSIGLLKGEHPEVQQPAAPKGSLIYEGELWLDAFTTDDGNLGITLTKGHPDDDDSAHFRDIYFDKEGNLRAVTADPQSRKLST
jgi:hypothetical protein